MTVVQRRRAEKLKESLEVAAELARADLPLPPKPRTEVPDLVGLDLTDLTDADLMDQMVLFARWADYSGGQLALAEVDESFANEYIDKLKAMGLVQTYDAEEKKGGVTRARAEKRLDPIYETAVQEKLNAYARRKLINARHTAFERDAALLSRELTRRGERDPVQRRVHRHGGAR